MSNSVVEIDESKFTPIKDLVHQIVACLVDDIDAINIDENNGDRSIVLNITVAKTDVGKIIGKSGKIISAIRSICENIAAKRNKRINIHVID